MLVLAVAKVSVVCQVRFETVTDFNPTNALIKLTPKDTKKLK